MTMEEQKTLLTQTLRTFVENYGWCETADMIRDIIDPYMGHEVNGQDWFAELFQLLLEKPDGSFKSS